MLQHCRVADDAHAPGALDGDEAVGGRLRRARGCLRRPAHLHALATIGATAAAILRPAIRSGTAASLLSVAEHLSHLLRVLELLGRQLLGRPLRLVRLVLWHPAHGPAHAAVRLLRRTVAGGPHTRRLLLRRSLLLLGWLALRLAPGGHAGEDVQQPDDAAVRWVLQAGGGEG